MRSPLFMLAAASLLMLQACGGTTPSAPSPATSESIAASVSASGLPVDAVTATTAENDPNKLLGRQNGYTARVSWHDTRIAAPPKDPAMPDTSDGGSLEVWPDDASARARYDLLQGVAQKMPAAGDGYDYLQGPVLVRLSRFLTPDQAEQYKKLLTIPGK